MKDKNVAAILALFLGGIGVHKFYLGRIGAGVLFLIFSWTFIPTLLGLIDFFVLALMDQDEFNRRYNGSNTFPAPVVVNMLPPAGYPPGYGYGSGYGYGQGAPPMAGPYGQPQPPGYGQPPGPGYPPRSTDELATQLEKLNELRIAGLLTEEEFSAQKARLLNTL